MTTKNNILPWQQASWDLLCQYIQQGRIPQALLLTGAKGLGKQSLAKQFAYTLLCANRRQDGFNCGHCHSCTLINAGNHPDLLSITPDEDKSSISINQIRQTVEHTYLKPQYEAHRAIIINPADAMTHAAANAFLKCLEEPGERTVFILIAEKPSKLPATIVSRCQIVAIKLNDADALNNWLQQQGIQNNQETLLNLVRNAMLSPHQISDASLLQQRYDCFRDWLAVANQKNYPAIVSEKWQKIPKTLVLDWQLSWLSDLIRCAHRSNLTKLCNQDMADAIQVLAQQLNLVEAYALYDSLLENRQQLDTQLNFQLMLEEILVQWQQLNWRD